jgi:hypothetical protein
VQLGQDSVQLVIDRGALGGRQARQAGVAEDAALQEVHHIEGRADDGLIQAERPHDRHGKFGVAQRLHHPVFAVDLVSAGQKLPRRLLAQHIAPVAGVDQEGRVGGAAAKLAHAHRPAKALHVL